MARTRTPLLARPMAFVRGLPDHSLLDQIVRGRAWIPLLGLLLAGIVAMQVEVLKLSAGMGRSLERGTALESRNQQLRASVAELSDDQRIEHIAAQMGMVMPAPTDVHFLSASSSGQVGRALANIHAPDATAFLAGLPAANAAAAGSTSTTTGTPVTAATPTTAAGTPSVAAGTTSATAGAPATTTAATTAATPQTTSVPVTAAAPTTSSSTGSPTAATPSTTTPVGG